MQTFVFNISTTCTKLLFHHHSIDLPPRAKAQEKFLYILIISDLSSVTTGGAAVRKNGIAFLFPWGHQGRTSSGHTVFVRTTKDDWGGGNDKFALGSTHFTEECVPFWHLSKEIGFHKGTMSNNSPRLTLILPLIKNWWGEKERRVGGREDGRKLFWQGTRCKVRLYREAWIPSWLNHLVFENHPRCLSFGVPVSTVSRCKQWQSGLWLSFCCTLTISGGKVNGTWPTPRAPGTVRRTLRASNQYFLQRWWDFSLAEKGILGQKSKQIEPKL